MSQAGTLLFSSSGPIPPNVPTTFVTDTGAAVPAANIINVVTPGGGTQGITTTGAGNTLTISLTDFPITGTVTTVGAVTGDVITFDLGLVPGTYTFDCKIAGFDAVTPSGAGFAIVGSVRTTGAAGVLLSSQAVDSFNDPATAATLGIIAVSGNDAIFRVTGAVGLTINWRANMQFTFVS